MTEIPSTPIEPAQTFPMDDNLMRYDYENHWYVLTITGAKKSRKDPIVMYGTEENATGKLEEISEQVYTWVETQVPNYPLVEYLMARNGYYRNLIFKMLLNQYRYEVRSSGGSLVHENGVNINETKSMPLSEIRGDRGIDGITRDLFLSSELAKRATCCVYPRCYRVGY